jgi:hypothetical protein
MSWASDYAAASNDMDEHVDECEACATGRFCPQGDDYAEAEYRAYARVRRDSDGNEGGRRVR